MSGSGSVSAAGEVVCADASACRGAHRQLKRDREAPSASALDATSPVKEAWAASAPSAQPPTMPSSTASSAAAVPEPIVAPQQFSTPLKSVTRVPSADSHSKPVAGPRGMVESLVAGEAAEKRRAMQEGTPVKMEPVQELCESAKKAQKPPDLGQVCKVVGVS